MKNILVFCSCFLISNSFAGDTYNGSTGVVEMPNVSVGNDNYEVSMQHQGNLVFNVTNAYLKSLADAVVGTWKIQNQSPEDETYLIFHTNGRFISIEGTGEGNGGVKQMEAGTYSINNGAGTITFNATTYLGNDSGDVTGTSEISVSGNVLNLDNYPFVRMN